MADQTYTGVMVALLPAESDPITAASSEPAHLTLAFLGTTEGLEPDDVQTVIDEVQDYALSLDGPLVVPVKSRGTLGEDGADVAFLETTESAWALRQGMLEEKPVTSNLAVENDKFIDKWQPHVTLGYPDTPAEGEYAGETVSFDRIAVWVGDEHHDFDMGGAVSDQTEAGLTASGVVIEFDSRSDDGDRIVGPFADRAAAEAYMDTLKGPTFEAEYSFFELAQVIADAEELEDDEMPADELEDGEEEITEIPVHGVATLEGKPTGDGRAFRPGAISFGRLPAPLGYEFESSHGGDNSRVAVVGRIDEFWTVPSETEGEGVFEVRWRGVIMPAKPYGALAIESIVDGSYDGLSVIVDSVEVDVTEEREAFRQRILHDMEETDGVPGEVAALEGAKKGEPMSEEDIEMLLDAFVGDGTQETTWFSKARVRRFDMVPTGAFQEGYTSLGHDFIDEMTPEQIEASAAALADCGCTDGIVDSTGDPVANARAAAAAIIAAGMTAEGYAPGTKDGPGWITHPVATSRIRRYWTRGKGAAKIRWGAPGDFNRCRAQLAKYVQNPEWLAGLCANMHKEALGIWPGEHHASKSLVASAEQRPLFAITAALAPIDAEYFRNPNLTRATGIVVDGDHIYGHIAAWNVCHIGNPEGPGRCTLAPRSASNYAQYRTGTVMTTEGPVAVGSITMGTGHAGGNLNARPAAAHYDNTGAVIADVAAGEDRFGIWFSGRIRPGVSDDDLFALQASGRISGDWRMIGGGYELVAALVVNVPGYPIIQPALVASADLGFTAIIGEGIVDEEAEAASTADPVVEGSAQALTAEMIADISVTAVEEYIFRAQRQAELDEIAPVRERVAAMQLTNARRRLALLNSKDA